MKAAVAAGIRRSLKCIGNSHLNWESRTRDSQKLDYRLGYQAKQLWTYLVNAIFPKVNAVM